MKIIDLIKYNKVSIAVTPRHLSKLGVKSATGEQLRSLVDMNKVSAELEIARRNGAQIIWSTSCVENVLEHFLLDYFMGGASQKCKKKDLMQREILQASSLSFNSKIQITVKVLNDVKLLTGKKKSKLQTDLANIRKWRDAFAHGKMKSNENGDIKLSYYDGEQKTKELKDDFLNLVEETFAECFDLVDQIRKKLDENTK